MQAEPVTLTYDHPRFREFFRSLYEDNAPAHELCSVIENPDKWSSQFCAFLSGTNVMPPDSCEDLYDYLEHVIWADAKRCVADSAEGPPKRWREYEFLPRDGRQPENIVADFTDWLGETPETGSRWPLKLNGPDLEVVDAIATAHRETRYGRQIVVFEVEAAP